MIINADPKKPIFLSVALKDGSMEAFDEINDAVAHATKLVEADRELERVIFVAVPRARVRMAVRVDPIDPPQLPAPEADGPALAGSDWEASQGLARNKPNGHDRLNDGVAS